jgi:glycerol-3-phosphate dehydrogenase
MGMTCIGTTDLDHTGDLNQEAYCTQAEVDYLLELMRVEFPEAKIVPEDVVSSFAGVRPIISSGKGINPSQERRDHSVWIHQGVVTVSGGKLTTFRVIAHDVLLALGWMDAHAKKSLLDTSERLFRHALRFPNELGNPKHAIEFNLVWLKTIEWILEHEMVVHLDDLLLRRTRFGNVHRNGGSEYLPQIQEVCQNRLAWDDARWAIEQTRYLEIVQKYYSQPQKRS